MPSVRDATVFTIGGIQSPCSSTSDIIIVTSVTVLSAPGRSALLMTKTSPISMMPALMAWMSSPMPGTSTTTVRLHRAHDLDFVLPDADGLDEHDVEAGGVEDVDDVTVAFASPPRLPRVAIERMKTPRSV
jgi:hypothetical protein